MPEIRPFRALRYDVARVGDLSKVVAQPYDKVDDRLREEYYARHPNHIIRIDHRKDEPDEGKYASAAAELDRWIHEGVLVEDSNPALYAIRQTYGVEGKSRVRRGICAMVNVEEFGSGRIHPHEETHAGPKADRLKLLRATRTHASHIFMLYPDPKRTIAAMLDQSTGRSPDLRAVDDFGEVHEAWRIESGALAAAFAPLNVIIADGHHRYETALAYRRECEAAGLQPAGAESFQNVLATLIDMDDEGLTCFPTHRVIRDRPSLDRAAFLKSVAGEFDIQTWPFDGADSEKRARKAMIESVAKDAPAFGLALPSGAHARLKIRNARTTASRVKSPRTIEWRSLDVNILHTVILEGALGITPDDTEHERFVDYVRSADKAVERVLSGRAACAFILNPVRMDQLQAVVRNGEKFPQKSTDFYPKMLSGFLMCRLRVGNQ
ncbi:MAG TPA: DUF1015 domain-containing protein [Planctomycetota bacterium]|nr:DUF1015 domain-containing protein [Planctomycetota bacterium]